MDVVKKNSCVPEFEQRSLAYNNENENESEKYLEYLK